MTDSIFSYDGLFSSDLRPMEYWSTVADNKLDDLSSGKNIGFTSGIKALDAYVRFRPQELTFIAAMSSMGKTSLGMNIVDHIADQIKLTEMGGVVAVFSAEMAGGALVHRMRAAIAGVNLHKLDCGFGSKQEIARMREAGERIRTKAIWIDDNTSPTTQQMLSQMERMSETVPIRAMMFDFLEMSGDEGPSEELRIGSVAKNLKAIAKKLEIPVIALAQVNDDANKRASKMPQLSDIRYSKRAGHLADLVIMPMRPSYYIESGDTVEGYDEDTAEGVALLNITKQRNGPKGLVECRWDAERMKFENKPEMERISLN